ncbi:hypothetical protein NDU88_005870, partial [Pleurodeles waltl]
FKKLIIIMKRERSLQPTEEISYPSILLAEYCQTVTALRRMYLHLSAELKRWSSSYITLSLV